MLMRVESRSVKMLDELATVPAPRAAGLHELAGEGGEPRFLAVARLTALDHEAKLDHRVALSGHDAERKSVR
jgi:hypothetical protein